MKKIIQKCYTKNADKIVKAYVGYQLIYFNNLDNEYDGIKAFDLLENNKDSMREWNIYKNDPNGRFANPISKEYVFIKPFVNYDLQPFIKKLLKTIK